MIRRLTAFIASLLIAAGACLATVAAGSAEAVTTVGTWTPTANSLSLLRYSFRATTLLDGRVLVEGGFAPGSYTTEAEIYDPATNAWSVISPMNQGRGEQSATLLADGRVLVAGGYAGPVLSSAEIFDPSTGQWQVTGSMHVNRTRQAAVRLCDGRVLVVGGWNGQGISAAETYDPSAGQWTLTAGSLPTPLQNPTAFLLPDCTVLVAGGAAGADGTPSAAAYIFHPDTGTFAATASMHHARVGHGGAELQDGRVLVMGGNTADSSTTAEVFDPATQQWSDVAPMNDPHTLGFGEDAQTLPDGQVLVPGDTANYFVAELYDPAANTWSFTGPMNAAHFGGATALLDDGRVLNAGGFDSANNLSTVDETYTLTSTLPDDDLAIAAHADMTANATGPSGATLTYSPPAVTDSDDATTPAPSCFPASGSQFPIGTTTVTCTATDPDDSNSPVTTSFAVNVEGAAAQLADLHQAVQGVGPGKSLANKIAKAQAYVAAGDSTHASSTLTAFINEVTAQSGKSVPASQAAQFIADAKRIQAVLRSADSCNAFGGAHQLPGAHGVVPAAYSDPGLTVPACGPRPGAGGGPTVYAYPGSSSFAGYQCVEFAERFLYYKDGVTMGGGTNGDEVVAKYAAQYPSMFTALANGTPNAAPVKGDVLSLSTLATFNSSDGGHTMVVQSSNVNSAGNGSITTVDENGTAAGVEVLTVTNWTVTYASFPYIEWLHLR